MFWYVALRVLGAYFRSEATGGQEPVHRVFLSPVSFYCCCLRAGRGTGLDNADIE